MNYSNHSKINNIHASNEKIFHIDNTKYIVGPQSLFLIVTISYVRLHRYYYKPLGY